MGFYGEIINTGEAPFVFDRIYSSRYHMEKMMANDGIYAGRFVLVSYDTSYTHNNFKRVYIKDEDKGANKTGIVLYKDVECKLPVKYKDFEKNIDAMGISTAAILSEIFYVTDGYFYTYYQCVGEVDGNAIFNYYQNLNILFNQAFRGTQEDTDAVIKLYLSEDLDESSIIKMKDSDEENGAMLHDIYVVREYDYEQNDKERAEGVFSFYECVGSIAGDSTTEAQALFKKLYMTIGRYEDETLENYVMNQKLDALYFGQETGIHSYDKTVWQKVYIGEKEKYIKVASLNSEFPDITLTIDPPTVDSSFSPYIDPEINGTVVENLHMQPQWGFRVAAANKALSTTGGEINARTGNYLSYLDKIKVFSEEFCNNYSKIFEELNNAKISAKNILFSNFESILDERINETQSNKISLGSFADVLSDDIENLKVNIKSLIGLETSDIDNIFTEGNKYYNYTFQEEYSYKDSTDNETYSFNIPNCYNYITRPFVFSDTITINEETEQEEEIRNDSIVVKEEGIEKEYIRDGDTENFKYNGILNPYIKTESGIIELIVKNTDVLNTLSGSENETVLNKFKEYCKQFCNFLNAYAEAIRYANQNFDNNLVKDLVKKSDNISSILQGVFNFNLEINLEEEEEVARIKDIDDTFTEIIPSINIVFDDKINSEGKLIEISTNIDEIKTILYQKILLIVNNDYIKSDEDITWRAKGVENNVYNFNGTNWVTEEATLQGDIYYNKSGFDYKTTYRDNDDEDYIRISPTGLSQVYNEDSDIWENKKYEKPDSEYNEKIEAPDVQELSIHLPSIGNTISDVWDIVYGEGKEEDDYDRKTDISWDSTNPDRIRLIDDVEEGYSYSKENLATVAGAINTTQDLIGRIIVEDIEIEGETYSSADSVDIEENSLLTSEYIESYLNKDYIYYLSDDKRYYIIQNKLNFNIDYLDSSKIISSREDYEYKVQGFVEVELENPNSLSQEKYYYDVIKKAYIYNPKYFENKNYIELKKENLKDAFLDELGPYSFKLEETEDGYKNLIKDDRYSWNEEDIYYDFENKIVGPRYLFIPGEYYYEERDDSGVTHVAAEKFHPGKPLFIFISRGEVTINPITEGIVSTNGYFQKIYDPTDTESEQMYKIPPFVLEKDYDTQAGMSYEDFGAYNIYVKKFQEDKFVPIDYADNEAKFPNCINNGNLSYDSDFIPIGSLIQIKDIDSSGITDVRYDEDNKCFFGILEEDFNEENIIDNYTANKYYYEKDSVVNGIKNYYLDTSKDGDKNLQYYNIVNAKNINFKVYKPNTYYIKDTINNEEVYVIDSSENFDSTKTYYERPKYYVTKEYPGSFNIGQEWDYNIKYESYILDPGKQRGTDTIEGNQVVNKDYYYDSNGGRQVTFVDDFRKGIYYTKNGNDFIPATEYNSSEKYYVQLIVIEYIGMPTEGRTYERYTGSDGREYHTKIINNKEYYINGYQDNENINISALTEIETSSDIKYLNIVFETWKPNKFFYLNNYGTIINQVNLVAESDLKKQYYFKELIGFGRDYSTINGLIVKFNQIIGDSESNSRDLKTLYGIINKLNDEINRLQMYDYSTIKTITNSILASYSTSVALSNDIKNIRRQVQGELGGLLLEEEAISNYTNSKDFYDIVGIDLNNNSQRETTDLIYSEGEVEAIGGVINNDVPTVGTFRSFRFNPTDEVEYYKCVKSIEQNGTQTIIHYEQGNHLYNDTGVETYTPLITGDFIPCSIANFTKEYVPLDLTVLGEVNFNKMYVSTTPLYIEQNNKFIQINSTSEDTLNNKNFVVYIKSFYTDENDSSNNIDNDPIKSYEGSLWTYNSLGEFKTILDENLYSDNMNFIFQIVDKSTGQILIEKRWTVTDGLSYTGFEEHYELFSGILILRLSDKLLRMNLTFCNPNKVYYTKDTTSNGISVLGLYKKINEDYTLITDPEETYSPDTQYYTWKNKLIPEFKTDNIINEVIDIRNTTPSSEQFRKLIGVNPDTELISAYASLDEIYDDNDLTSLKEDKFNQASIFSNLAEIRDYLEDIYEALYGDQSMKEELYKFENTPFTFKADLTEEKMIDQLSSTSDVVFDVAFKYDNKEYKQIIIKSSGTYFDDTMIYSKEMNALKNPIPTIQVTGSYPIDSDFVEWLFKVMNIQGKNIKEAFEPYYDNSNEVPDNFSLYNTNFVKGLKRRNKMGILARLSALDTVLSSTSDDEETLLTALGKIRTEYSTKVLPTIVNEATQKAIAENENATKQPLDIGVVENIPEKLGFKLVGTPTASFIQNGVYTYNFRIQFNPTEPIKYGDLIDTKAWIGKEVAYLQVDGLTFDFANSVKWPMNIRPAFSGSKNIVEADMNNEGQICLSFSEDLIAAKNNLAYDYILEGSINPPEGSSNYDVAGTYTITFQNENLPVQKNAPCNYKRSFKHFEGMSFTTPKAPNLKGCKFNYWECKEDNHIHLGSEQTISYGDDAYKALFSSQTDVDKPVLKAKTFVAHYTVNTKTVLYILNNKLYAQPDSKKIIDFAKDESAWYFAKLENKKAYYLTNACTKQKGTEKVKDFDNNKKHKYTVYKIKTHFGKKAEKKSATLFSIFNSKDYKRNSGNLVYYTSAAISFSKTKKNCLIHELSKKK